MNPKVALIVWLALAFAAGWFTRYLVEPVWTMQLDRNNHGPIMLNTRTGAVELFTSEGKRVTLGVDPK